MKESNDSFVYELESSISVHNKVNGKNQLDHIDKLYLQAPSMKGLSRYSLPMKKKFFEAMFSMTQNVSRDEAERKMQQDSSSDGLDAKSILAILYGAKDFDILSFYDICNSFLVNVCFKDEDLQNNITLNELRSVKEEELEGLVAKYIEVFFSTSWMKMLS